MIDALGRLVAYRRSLRNKRLAEYERCIGELAQAYETIERLDAEVHRLRTGGTSLESWVPLHAALDGAALAGAMDAETGDSRARLMQAEAAFAELDRKAGELMGKARLLDNQIVEMDRSIEKLSRHHETLVKTERKRAAIREDTRISDLRRAR